jgi:hypothetical protein
LVHVTHNNADEALGVDAAQQEALSRKALAALRAQLQALLDAPLPDARTFNTLQKQRARVEHRGGKLSPALAAAAGVAGTVPKKSHREGRKTTGKRGAQAVAVEDNSWKKRGSFFVFAK